jgi:UDP-2-acetamido-3-amino-2,3-dideoxy-glucuronate N-acetyltransferase
MPIKDVLLGAGVSILHPDLVNIYGCRIGVGTKIGPFVEIQKDSTIGAFCKISSHSFICSGVIIEDRVMIAHGVVFTNDLFPRAANKTGALQDESDWDVIPTQVCSGASIGSNATILAGICIGAGALVGAGAVVTRDVPANTVVAGVPARVLRTADEIGGDPRALRAAPKRRSAERRT